MTAAALKAYADHVASCPTCASATDATGICPEGEQLRLPARDALRGTFPASAYPEAAPFRAPAPPPLEPEPEPEVIEEIAEAPVDWARLLVWVAAGTTLAFALAVVGAMWWAVHYFQTAHPGGIPAWKPVANDLFAAVLLVFIAGVALRWLTGKR